MANLAFTGATIDRASDVRAEPERLAALLADPAATTVAALGDRVLVDRDAAELARRPAPARVRARAGDPIVLGVEHGTAVLGLDLESLDDVARRELVGAGELVPLRDAGSRLAQAEGGLAAYLVALLGWHRRHGFCANCGAATDLADGGLARRCPRCAAAHFPRTDPVVIMLVEHDDRLLLGRRAGWPPGRYSVLAGFVAPGETPEEAVVREVAEESGIAVRDPRYVTAQPWPFPASLMLGFEARADGGTPAAGDGELEDVAWFDRAEVAAAGDWSPDGDRPGSPARLQLPPSVSIARHLIDGWLARR